MLCVHFMKVGDIIQSTDNKPWTGLIINNKVESFVNYTVYWFDYKRSMFHTKHFIENYCTKIRSDDIAYILYD